LRLAQDRARPLAPIRNIAGEDFLVESRVRLGCVVGIDLERAVDRQEPLGLTPGGNLRDTIDDRERRHLKQIDDEDDIIELRA